MISAVMSAISRRRTPEQREGGRGRDSGPALARDSDRSGCGKPKRYAAKRRRVCDYPTRIKSIPFGWVRPVAEYGPLRYSDIIRPDLSFAHPNAHPKPAELHD